ncbi:hypothetical protein ACGFX4_20030 [Kitasatospora sp. NPDC048365]|uniref:hypothetical protein n=1 Tax=Kitasatospora sp. NPDC048365 TaxID=3364050 RepID=UPI003714F1E5
MTPLTTAQSIENSTSASLFEAARTASALATLAETDASYDELAAITASLYATRAQDHLPLRESTPDTSLPPVVDVAGVHALAVRLDKAAEELAQLGREATLPEEVYNRHAAALNLRNAAIALRNAVGPVERTAP